MSIAEDGLQKIQPSKMQDAFARLIISEKLENYKHLVPDGTKTNQAGIQIAVPASARFLVAPTFSDESFAWVKSMR
jgi:hypothetical protein